MLKFSMSGLSEICSLYQKYYPNLLFQIYGDHDIIDRYPQTLPSVMGELIGNCVERPNRPAGTVSIKISTKEIRISDDVTFSPDEIKTILGNLNSSTPRSTKPFQDGMPDGGAGVIGSRRRLDQIGGKLDYFQQNGNIVARVKLC